MLCSKLWYPFTILHVSHTTTECVQTSLLFSQPVPLLKKGATNPNNSGHHRVRADFLGGKKYVSIDVSVTGELLLHLL